MSQETQQMSQALINGVIEGNALIPQTNIAIGISTIAHIFQSNPDNATFWQELASGEVDQPQLTRAFKAARGAHEARRIRLIHADRIENTINTERINVFKFLHRYMYIVNSPMVTTVPEDLLSSNSVDMVRNFLSNPYYEDDVRGLRAMVFAAHKVLYTPKVRELSGDFRDLFDETVNYPQVRAEARKRLEVKAAIPGEFPVLTRLFHGREGTYIPEAMIQTAIARELETIITHAAASAYEHERQSFQDSYHQRMIAFVSSDEIAYTLFHDGFIGSRLVEEGKFEEYLQGSSN